MFPLDLLLTVLRRYSCFSLFVLFSTKYCCVIQPIPGALGRLCSVTVAFSACLQMSSEEDSVQFQGSQCQVFLCPSENGSTLKRNNLQFFPWKGALLAVKQTGHLESFVSIARMDIRGTNAKVR